MHSGNMRSKSLNKSSFLSGFITLDSIAIVYPVNRLRVGDHDFMACDTS